ncbi:MAG: hypothetical protein DID92_2727745044 [Candidatus Nitrotoga sp. SPKER]|nr:MAG: hypothetical protein DID92_2727745044 [Candidatus Nitrotoga sp. SPKER]
MINTVKFILSYEGKDADNHQIDLYDVSQALIGFQRSIALTTHLVINGEIITQAPALKGAQILASPAEDGSWQIVAAVLASGLYTLGTAPQDTPVGHIVYSLYDYVLKANLGVHVDYDKSIGQLIEDHKKLKGEQINLEPHKVDALIEKCSTAITEIHRPIFKTQTASSANIIADIQSQRIPIGIPFTLDTYEYIHESITDVETTVINGRISSYNSNTFKGRIYVTQEGRPITFELSDSCRSNYLVSLVTASLAANALKDYTSEWITVYCRVYRNTTRTGLLKSYKIIEVSHTDLS